MRVTLIFPQTTDVMRGGDNRLPPNALYYLASILRARGHEVQVEPRPRPDLLSPGFVETLASGCDLLGISSNSINWRFARGLAVEARRARRDLPIVLGGIHASLFPEHALHVTPADYVLRGEAEESFPELLDTIAAGRGFEAIGGLTWRDKAGTIRSNPSRPLLSSKQLEAAPTPAFDLLPEGEYRGIAIESSRGCAFNCAFCSIPYRRSFRSLGAEPFVRRLTESLDLAEPRLKSPFGRTSVYILDDCFTTSKKRVLEIFERLAPLRDRVRYGIEARADQVTDAMARTLEGSEFWLIQMGLESGYPEGLRKVNKGLKIEDIERACSILRDHGLAEATDYAFILGFPWEDRDDCLRTLDFAVYLHMNYGGHISLAWYEPFPGSPLWDRRVEDRLPLQESLYDDVDFNWREDPGLFRAIRPRMTWDECMEIEDVIHALTALDPKYLQFRNFKESWQEEARRTGAAA
jgi:anaerobic magnesium-protoporphyrin IX monomethyl ester cyclase